jgi:hypothetical protein
VDALDRFAAAAEVYVRWARDGRDRGAENAREALRRLADLYRAGLDLPQDAGDDEGEEDRPSHDEWRAVYEGLGVRLPFRRYSAVVDPLEEDPPSDDHDVADDLADVWRDVVQGLRSFNVGHRGRATWGWRFGFENHWGAHAVSALRALHSWLAQDGSLFLGGPGPAPGSAED